MSEPSRVSARADVVVFLGTSWARLERQNTRWRAVTTQWAGDARVERLRVVDYPSLSPGNLLRPRAEAIPSWDARIDAFTGRVPLWRAHATPLDGAAWRAAGRALSRVLGPPRGRRVLVAATPLWVPVLAHVPADGRGFDAVDDWRQLPALQPVRSHVISGYRAAALVDTTTSVSQSLSERLRADFGFSATPVPNGVDLGAFTSPALPLPYSLPDRPFAVYVGVVQERVDFALLAAARRVMPVVVAGPAAPQFAEKLDDAGVLALGAVDTRYVPSLLRAAAVGLVPHHVDALTTSMHPMKTLEYLAAGLPVVTTPVPIGVESARVFVAADPEAFAQAVSAAGELGRLPGPDPAVRGASWRAVADALFDAHLAPRR